MVGAPMDTFRERLERDLWRRVLDHTGLEGPYTLELQYWSPRDHDGAPMTLSANPPNDEWRALPDALREQLGLRLDPRVVQEDVLVIDHIALPDCD
jgi:uncharacterized protein (TIGR03435 family)